jgi:hypothetical protein
VDHAEAQHSPSPEVAAPVETVAAAPTAAPAASLGGLDPAGVLSLQRNAGNAAVARMLDPSAAGDDGHAEEPGDGTGIGEEVPFPQGMTFHAEPEEFVAYAAGPKLEGKTTAHWDSLGHFDPDPPKATRATGCGCPTCMRVQGSFVVEYTSNPTVKLPDVPQNLTDCQKRNAEKFIRDVLEPHEQQHVSTFKKFFDGKTTRKFDLKACSAEDVKTQLDSGYVAELEARKKVAQAESDKLDANGANQFTWDMDADCKP